MANHHITDSPNMARVKNVQRRHKPTKKPHTMAYKNSATTKKHVVNYKNSDTKHCNNKLVAEAAAALPKGSVVLLLDADDLGSAWAIAEKRSADKPLRILIPNNRTKKECTKMKRQRTRLQKEHPNINVDIRPETTADHAMLALGQEGTVVSLVYLDYCGTFAKYGGSGLHILATTGILPGPDAKHALVMFTFDRRNEHASSDRDDSTSAGTDALRRQIRELEGKGKYIDVEWAESNQYYSYWHKVGLGGSNMWCAYYYMRRGEAAPTPPSAPIIACERSGMTYTQIVDNKGAVFDVRLAGLFRNDELWHGFHDEVRHGQKRVRRRVVVDGKVSEVNIRIVASDTDAFEKEMNVMLDNHGKHVRDVYKPCEKAFLNALPKVTDPESMLGLLRTINPKVDSLAMKIPYDFEENTGELCNATVTAVYTETHARYAHQSNHLDLEPSVAFEFDDFTGTEELTFEQFKKYTSM
jgi:hypothetical protein